MAKQLEVKTVEMVVKKVSLTRALLKQIPEAKELQGTKYLLPHKEGDRDAAYRINPEHAVCWVHANVLGDEHGYIVILKGKEPGTYYRYKGYSKQDVAGISQAYVIS